MKVWRPVFSWNQNFPYRHTYRVSRVSRQVSWGSLSGEEGFPITPPKVTTRNNPSEDSAEFMEVTDVTLERDKTQSLGGELYTLYSALSFVDGILSTRQLQTFSEGSPATTHWTFFFLFGFY